MPTKTFEPIASTTLSSNANSISFSNIPATYTDLYVILSMKDTGGATIGIRTPQFTPQYHYYCWVGADNAGNVSRGTQQVVDRGYIGQASSSDWSSCHFWILNYSNTTSGTKNVLSMSASPGYSSIWTSQIQYSGGTAINEFNVWAGAQNFVTGTTVTVYGILKA